MEPFLGMKHLCESMHGIIAANKEGGLDLLIPRMFRGEMVDRLAMTAAIGDSDEVRHLARIIIRSAAMSHNIWCDSIQPLYKVMSRGKTKPLTIPAFNMRGLTYFIARSIFRVARRDKVGPFIFELSPAEMYHTGQTPLEYTTAVLAAALREHYEGPVFMQGDHFSPDGIHFGSDPDSLGPDLESLIKDSIDAGFYNFDLNGIQLTESHNTNTDPDFSQQTENMVQNIELLNRLQPRNIVVNIGTGIANTADVNTSVNSVRKFLQSLADAIAESGLKTSVSKFKIQAGTSEKSVDDPDENAASKELDFSQLQALSDVVKNEFSLAGTVIPITSIESENVFNKLADCGVVEIHLGTELQNLIFDHSRFPAGLREEIHSFLETEYPDTRQPDWSDQLFYFKKRIRAWKHFKRTLWTLDHRTRSVMCSYLEDKFALLFEGLNLQNTQKLIKNNYKKMRPVPITIPDELREL